MYKKLISDFFFYIFHLFFEIHHIKTLIFIRNPYWILFWVISLIGTMCLGLYFKVFVHFSHELNSILGIGMTMGMLICFIVSKITIPGGYSISKQAICHMGRTQTKKGEGNLTAAFFFVLLFVLQAFLIIFLGNLLSYQSDNSSWNVIPYFCYFSAIFGVLTGIVPIDLYEKLHIRFAFIYFISCNLWILYTLGILWILGEASFWMQLITIIIVTMSICYIWGYIWNYRYTALFQKIWLLNMIIATVLLLNQFS